MSNPHEVCLRSEIRKGTFSSNILCAVRKTIKFDLYRSGVVI